GLLAQVGRAVDLRQARVTAWVDHAAIVLPAVGGGNEGRAKPGCGERRIDAGSRRVPGTQASQPGGALREKRRPGLAGPPLVPRRGGGWWYQITTWLSASRTMASPALQPNAGGNAGMLLGAPIARKLAGACGSVFSRTFSSSGVKLRRQTVAQFRKKRWFSV